MSQPENVHCPLCATSARLLHRGYPGYRRPATYHIFACDYCDLQFASPFRATGDVYEAIYRQPEIIPGYDRYAAYAREVVDSPAPLQHLASREAMYWFVAQALASFAPGASIVEVGSGYGYLTYSLSRAGFDVKGVDISESAVKAAKARFGDLYLCEDITQFAQRLPSATDAVVMTEVLEHLERPLEVLNAIKAALRQGGKLIMTTPNRGFNGADALWRTDLPPVHLAWYSKTSIREMARRVGLSVTFQDFTTFNDARVAGIKPEGEGSIGGSILDADGAVLRRAAPSATRPTFKRWREEHWPQLARLERKRKFSRRALAHYARETDIIGAILTRT